jgi:hypothetical protein
LLSATVLTTFGLRDGERTPMPSNGSSMKNPRLLKTTTGNLTHLTSNLMEVHPTLDALLPTQDGGNCSNIKMLSLSVKEERYWKSKATLTRRTETLVF